MRRPYLQADEPNGDTTEGARRWFLEHLMTVDCSNCGHEFKLPKKSLSGRIV